MHFCEVSYEDMLPFGDDYRVILHKPDGKRKYYAMKNDNDQIVACLELLISKTDIHFNCVFVPEEYRGHGYAYKLLMWILYEYNGYTASAQCNNWSIKTFLKAGFHIERQKQFKYWTAYYVRR